MNGDDMDIVIPGEEDEECKKDSTKQQSGKQGKLNCFSFRWTSLQVDIFLTKYGKVENYEKNSYS